MGYSSEMMIAETNRNEATEAENILGTLRDELVMEFLNTDDDDEAAVLNDWREQIDSAIGLIRKFSQKHQPDVQRCK